MDKLGNIELGGHKYSVIIQELISPNPGTDLYGRHEITQNQILINEVLTLDRAKETLIHEVLHGILVNSGQEHPENIIDALANGLFQLGIGDVLWKKVQKKS